MIIQHEILPDTFYKIYINRPVVALALAADTATSPGAPRTTAQHSSVG